MSGRIFWLLFKEPKSPGGNGSDLLRTCAALTWLRWVASPTRAFCTRPTRHVENPKSISVCLEAICPVRRHNLRGRSAVPCFSHGRLRRGCLRRGLLMANIRPCLSDTVTPAPEAPPTSLFCTNSKDRRTQPLERHRRRRVYSTFHFTTSHTTPGSTNTKIQMTFFWLPSRLVFFSSISL